MTETLDNLDDGDGRVISIRCPWSLIYRICVGALLPRGLLTSSLLTSSLSVFTLPLGISWCPASAGFEETPRAYTEQLAGQLFPV